ncbi:MAG: cupin domain-containing protein [Clostridia bacterium]|nr:cupin domain-containing protein [Clostridia bacterium]
MIRSANEMETEIRHEMRGGKGDVTFIHAFKGDEMTAPCRLCATLILEAGCSIGTHRHEGEDEVYYILSGTGRLSDGVTETVVTAGDAVLTGNGESHSIENIGDEPLKIFAVVATYAE